MGYIARHVRSQRIGFSAVLIINRVSSLAILVITRINKLTSVFYASVLLLMINCVITLSKWLWNREPRASGSAVNFDNVMTKVIINKQTHKTMTSICCLQ